MQANTQMGTHERTEESIKGPDNNKNYLQRRRRVGWKKDLKGDLHFLPLYSAADELFYKHKITCYLCTFKIYTFENIISRQVKEQQEQ